MPKRLVAAAALLAFVLTTDLAAQPTNVEVLQTLAAGCASELDLPDTLRVDGAAARPYIRTAIVSSLIDRGVSVFSMERDSTAALRIHSDQPHVEYARRDGHIHRIVRLTVGLGVEAPDGRVTHEETCSRAFDDVLDRRALASVQSPAFPEASAPPPRASWRRRYAEPIIMAGATAVTVVLFFSLRSKRTPDE